MSTGAGQAPAYFAYPSPPPQQQQQQQQLPPSSSLEAGNSTAAFTSRPPAPPPKPGGQESSGRSTPTAGLGTQLRPLRSVGAPAHEYYGSGSTVSAVTAANSGAAAVNATVAAASGQDLSRSGQTSYSEQDTQDPGELWLPKVLQDKSKQDLADVLANADLLAALTHSSTTAHPTVAAVQDSLRAALAENITLATHLKEVEARLVQLRASTQTQLLATHAGERQWKQKQAEVDRALASFAPSSLYQRLSQGVQEQEMVCRALEESFLEGDGGIGSSPTEREVADWVRRYREAKKIYYARRERKERWDEGRVGGWR